MIHELVAECSCRVKIGRAASAQDMKGRFTEWQKAADFEQKLSLMQAFAAFPHQRRKKNKPVKKFDFSPWF